MNSNKQSCRGAIFPAEPLRHNMRENSWNPSPPLSNGLQFDRRTKKAALEAGKQGMKTLMKKRNTSRIDLVGTSLVGGSGRSGLCGVFSPLRLRVYRRRDCRAGGDMQGRFLPGAGTGAFVLLPETAENGDASGYPENPAGQMTGCRPIFCSGGFREKRFFRSRSDGNRPVRQRLRRHKKNWV